MELEKLEKLERIVESEKLLNEIKDVDVLLEQILSEARTITNADAGSIYVVEGDELVIKYAQNETQQKKLLPGEKLPYLSNQHYKITEQSIAGYCAKHKRLVNIEDCYNIPAGLPYSFFRKNDEETGYKSKSILSIPLKVPSGKLRGVLQLINAQDAKGNIIPFDSDAELFATHFASSAAQTLDRSYILQNYLKRMTMMAQLRDPRETFEHVERVSAFSLEIYDRWASDHNIDEAEKKKFRDNLKIASKCHDFGKVGIEDKILKKAGLLDHDEREIMKGHTCIGAKLFYDSENDLDVMCFHVALYHHVWWNGGERSYPGRHTFEHYKQGDLVSCEDTLKGDEIPLAARIVAVADVFDALSHKRVYKSAWSIEDAIDEIKRCSGTQFDPEVVEAFMEMKERITLICKSLG